MAQKRLSELLLAAPEILTGRGVPDQHQVVEEPCDAKVCAAGRGVESLTQSGEVRRNTSGPSDSPEDESQRGKEHVGKARGIGRR